MKTYIYSREELAGPCSRDARIIRSRDDFENARLAIFTGNPERGQLLCEIDSGFILWPNSRAQSSRFDFIRQAPDRPVEALSYYGHTFLDGATETVGVFPGAPFRSADEVHATLGAIRSVPNVFAQPAGNIRLSGEPIAGAISRSESLAREAEREEAARIDRFFDDVFDGLNEKAKNYVIPIVVGAAILGLVLLAIAAIRR